SAGENRATGLRRASLAPVDIQARAGEPAAGGGDQAGVLSRGMKSVDLAESYAFCERVARERAKNFYYSFLLLPQEKRLAMCAVYAFMRYCDDLSDDEGVADRAAEIARWEADLGAALAGRAPKHPLWPALFDTVARYRIPHEYFHEMIEGVRSDLTP